jgi:uncharacterized sodium:solute symporter family permease YidK
MKENLSLFWLNMKNNKYWIPLALFLIFSIVGIREDVQGLFETQGGFWFLEIFCIVAFLIVVIMTWITKDSQKDDGKPNPYN